MDASYEQLILDLPSLHYMSKREPSSLNSVYVLLPCTQQTEH